MPHQVNSDSTITKLNRKYENEISIDFQGLFKGTAGSALTWKKKKHLKIGEVSQKEAIYYRFQIALSGSLPFGQASQEVDTSSGHYVSSLQQQFSIDLKFGKEKIKSFGRFSTYYGIDAGPLFNYTKDGFSGYLQHNGNYWINGPTLPAQTYKYGISAIPFVGCKYRFSEHFSASIESGLNLSYSYSVVKTFEALYYPIQRNSFDLVNKVVNTSQYSTFALTTLYLRFLTLNYHF